MKPAKIIKTAITSGGIVETFKELDNGEVYVEITIKQYLPVRDLRKAGLGHWLVEEMEIP
jgi:hypothetical protein